jgi:hypothetical protein
MPATPAREAPTREAIARIEVGHTTIAPATARTLVAVFLLAIVSVPVIESWSGLRAAGNDGAPTAWAHVGALGGEVRAAWRQPDASVRDASWWRRVVAANRAVLAALDRFEDALDHEARIGRLLRPRAQAVLSGWLGAGNERVFCGEDGWLFYRFDVEHVTGPGFLTPAWQRARVARAPEWTPPPQPDPRAALVDFARQLEARGIALVVVPVPVKPTVHPERLVRGADRRPDPVQNASHARFVEDLRQANVLVFDIAPALVERRRTTGAPQYLATDTHWRPEAMAFAAEQLAAYLQAHVALPPVPDPGYQRVPHTMTNTGDTTAMLDLPKGQTLYPPETVVIQRVLGPDGAPWRPSRSADVLVLGDSFTNVYSLASMGWGDAAGFAEQLSYALRRPVDRIVQNDDGAFATRALLGRELAAGRDRLAGKRVVVYQFATRELSRGDWKILDLPVGVPARP